MKRDDLLVEALGIAYADPARHDAWTDELQQRAWPVIDLAMRSSRSAGQVAADAKAMWFDLDSWRCAKECGLDDEYWRLPMRLRRAESEEMRARFLRSAILPKLYGDARQGWRGRASVVETAAFFLGMADDVWCRAHEVACADAMLADTTLSALATRARQASAEFQQRVDIANADGEWEDELSLAMPQRWTSDMVLAMVSPAHSTLPPQVWEYQSALCMQECAMATRAIREAAKC